MLYMIIVGARETGEEEYEYRHAGGAYAYGPFTREEAYEFCEEAEEYISNCRASDFVYGEPFVMVAPFREPTRDHPMNAVDYWRLQPEDV